MLTLVTFHKGADFGHISVGGGERGAGVGYEIKSVLCNVVHQCFEISLYEV